MPSTQGKEGYGYAFTRGTPVEMANACLNNQYQGRGTGISFHSWVSQRGLGLEAQIRLSRRGCGGRPRIPARCQVGTTGVCSCKRDERAATAA